MREEEIGVILNGVLSKDDLATINRLKDRVQNTIMMKLNEGGGDVQMLSTCRALNTVLSDAALGIIDVNHLVMLIDSIEGDVTSLLRLIKEIKSEGDEAK